LSKSLLNGVNELLKRVQIIQGDQGLLTTITDSGIQNFIDIAIQILNELVDHLYDTANQPHPNELAEATITLVTGDRDYALAAGLNQLRFPLLDETNGRVILEHPGGYLGIVNSQYTPANYTGQPFYGAIRPTDGELYLDYIPTAAENGLVYKYRYDKDLELTDAADTFPFKDVVFRALIPAGAELWNQNQKNKFNGGLFKAYMGRAARYLIQQPPRESWKPGQVSNFDEDPFVER